MMLQLGDNGVVSSVDEEELVYVDKKELEQLISSYRQLEEENEQLKQTIECLEADKMELQQYIKRIQGDVE